MPQPTQTLLDPRKQPVQARSAVTVDAILEATIQVLLSVGKDRLTTTLVAARAGVSVGTLYQYFPNKSALLQATLTRHLDGVTERMEAVCRQQRGNPLQAMAIALISTFLRAKMLDTKTSVALYAVSSDLDGAKIAHRNGARSVKAIAAMLSTSSDGLARDPHLVALVLHGSMAGVSRRLLESPAPQKHFAALLEELTLLTSAYLAACSKPPAA